MKLFFRTAFSLLLLYSCSTKSSKEPLESDEIALDTPINSSEALDKAIILDTLASSLSDTSFLFLKTLSRDFVYDMKYATADNFLKIKVYSCDQCLIRKEVAEALIRANDLFVKQGFRIKLFDCYRPLSIQKKMWEVFPDGRYVANPKFGSVHNRGGAVDITLVDVDGNELDMGTSFDHFGIEAHHSYRKLSETILSNRRLLKQTMETAGFSAIDTEWWHYNFSKAKVNYPVSNFETKCN